jgi:hypothetical protein
LSGSSRSRFSSSFSLVTTASGTPGP